MGNNPRVYSARPRLPQGAGLPVEGMEKAPPLGQPAVNICVATREAWV